MSKVLITQSNYIPWKGFFDSLAYCDVFVVFDEMQYTKRDWRNRNIIKTTNGLRWLTIPVQVKGKYFQKINETEIADPTWNVSHLNTIRSHYREAKCFGEMEDWLAEIYMSCNHKLISDINLHFIKAINDLLGIKVKIMRSRDYVLTEDRTERLVSICRELGASEYWSGPAAKAYMELEQFRAHNIQVKYWDYSGYPEYDQIHGDFEHGVSILDLILNQGKNARKFMKFV